MSCTAVRALMCSMVAAAMIQSTAARNTMCLMAAAAMTSCTVMIKTMTISLAVLATIQSMPVTATMTGPGAKMATTSFIWVTDLIQPLAAPAMTRCMATAVPTLLRAMRVMIRSLAALAMTAWTAALVRTASMAAAAMTVPPWVTAMTPLAIGAPKAAMTPFTVVRAMIKSSVAVKMTTFMVAMATTRYQAASVPIQSMAVLEMIGWLLPKITRPTLLMRARMPAISMK